MLVRKVAVVGAGTMGAAIAELFAFNGLEVVLKDLDQELVNRGLGRVKALVEELVRYHAERPNKEIARVEELGVRLTEDQRAAIHERLKPKVSPARGKEIVNRVRGVTSWDDLSDVDLAVEAVFEEVPVKREVLQALDHALPETAFIGTNTSSLSISLLARGLAHAGNTLVTHFFNPPVTLPLVEVAGGVETREDSITEVIDFLGGLRNHRYPLLPIRVKESPGFVVNRILIPVMNEACFALQEGLASSRDIDQAMKAGAGLPMGPFELADLIGLDVTLAVAEVLHHDFGDSKYRVSPLLRRLVDAGHLGRKTGRGFYEYT